MHTQNVKTAAPESSERCGKTTTLRMDGFITDISSSHPFDVIRADVVISRLEIYAGNTCGQHAEIYEYTLTSSVVAHLKRLPEKDQAVFLQAAEKKGLTLTDEEVVRTANAYCDLRNELFEEE
ncbi:hypothetical protein PCO86_22285 (plasmid) [Pectobacteriaceae bacterium CE70]|nr:hypothetical protein [Prodigiosinella sp. LS101]WJV60577.1 hypothetical protein PCO84_23130 [Pectobacteriaceae bacterium C111]WJV64887.1 hypothetical protein PCO87_23135 [Pectobacteriaceae bacterium C52]WJV69181.1 hypothetical protein PCO86_22285 [Pectobacteriaceae bacterium CE70]WJY13108.1 hypothetical protein PCO80_22450 [Pectobacteriaceae bacterium C80]WJY17401.1 hypothetical protein PCO82_22645 [Pectobacteriaceae bacterium CE90]